ncbi:predicted protein [Coccidioides posadasii str. Silveira]|uniref:Predicted protein n=1 Tax=Coccidioides posadasii (strain RMSCC 757 / Silveira) TaxID=443226 RepID=E9DE64_COCPS|nr:predicted protein [Coccidioides posadasii str. Silveira]
MLWVPALVPDPVIGPNPHGFSPVGVEERGDDEHLEPIMNVPRGPRSSPGRSKRTLYGSLLGNLDADSLALEPVITTGASLRNSECPRDAVFPDIKIRPASGVGFHWSTF